MLIIIIIIFSVYTAKVCRYLSIKILESTLCCKRLSLLLHEKEFSLLVSLCSLAVVALWPEQWLVWLAIYSAKKHHSEQHKCRRTTYTFWPVENLCHHS